MSIYVDGTVTYDPIAIKDAQTRRVGTEWCHFWCDPGDEMELLHVAKLIGLKLEWFQRRPNVPHDIPHFDLVPNKRRLAILHGATAISMREWMRNNPRETRKWDFQ